MEPYGHFSNGNGNTTRPTAGKAAVHRADADGGEEMKTRSVFPSRSGVESRARRMAAHPGYEGGFFWPLDRSQDITGVGACSRESARALVAKKASSYFVYIKNPGFISSGFCFLHSGTKLSVPVYCRQTNI